METSIDNEQRKENPWNNMKERREEEKRKSMEQYERKKRRRKGKNPSHIYDRKGKIHHHD
jgi:hypothetical protein